MDEKELIEGEAAISELEDQSNLNTTVTISTPDVVSSCEGSPQLLDSFGILDPAAMEEFSNLTMSVEKLPNMTETNRNIDETFDAVSFPSETPNTTVVLSKDNDSSPLPLCQASTKTSLILPSLSPSLALAEENSVKRTPDHFPDTTPCHSTPLHGLDDVLNLVAPFVDEFEHHGGAESGNTDDDNIDLVSSKNATLVLEAQASLQSLADKDTDFDVTSSSSKLNPTSLTSCEPQKISKSLVKPRLTIASKQPEVSKEKMLKPKLHIVEEGRYVASKLVNAIASRSTKPVPREVVKGVDTVASYGRVPRNKSPLLKLALTRRSSMALSASKPPVTVSASLLSSTRKRSEASVLGEKQISKSYLKTQQSDYDLSKNKTSTRNSNMSASNIGLNTEFKMSMRSTNNDENKENVSATLGARSKSDLLKSKIKSPTIKGNVSARQMYDTNISSANPVSKISLKTQRSESDLSRSKSSNVNVNKNKSENRSNIPNVGNKSLKTDKGVRSESNLLRSKSYVINSNNTESGIGSNTSDITSKSTFNTEIKINKLAAGAKSKSQVLLPKTGVASQKQVTKKNTAVEQKVVSTNSIGKNKALPGKQKSSNLSSRQSMSSLSKAAVSMTTVSNNNTPKTIAGGNTGARPKILSSSKISSSSSLKPLQTKQSKASNVTRGASCNTKFKFVASNSYNDSEVPARPSLPQRSLSNLSLKNPNNESRKVNPTNGHNGTNSKLSPFRIPRSPSRSTQNLSTRNTQPDLVKTTAEPSLLENELYKIKLELVEKSRQQESAMKVIDKNIAAFDVLAIVTRNVVNKLELSKGINHDLITWKTNYESLQLEMEQCKKSHQVSEEDFNRLLTNLGKDIETMCRKHEEERKSLMEANKCKLEAQRHDFYEEKRKKKEAHEKEIALLRERHEVELKKVNSQMVLSMAREKKLFINKEKEMSDSFDDEKKKLEEKIQQLEAKVSALVINLMDGPDHRDGVIGEMQKEVDSLEAVLEIRNAEIKSLSEENEKLNLKTAHFNAMKVKVGNLESQVEDMKELLAMKRSKERKLDAELHELQESMHKTSREKRRLSIEKEQLEWRMRQGVPFHGSRVLADAQSQSFSGETQHSSRNYRTYHFRSPSLNNTEPLPLPLFNHTLDVSTPTPSNSSTPSVLDFKASRASVSYQLDMSGTSNSSTPGNAAKFRRQRRLENGLGDRE